MSVQLLSLVMDEVEQGREWELSMVEWLMDLFSSQMLNSTLCSQWSCLDSQWPGSISEGS